MRIGMHGKRIPANHSRRHIPESTRSSIAHFSLILLEAQSEESPALPGARAVVQANIPQRAASTVAQLPSRVLYPQDLEFERSRRVHYRQTREEEARCQSQRHQQLHLELGLICQWHRCLLDGPSSIFWWFNCEKASMSWLQCPWCDGQVWRRLHQMEWFVFRLSNTSCMV